MPRQENTKELFLEVALKLFAEYGYEKVKISDISKAVGCAPSALYKHYSNKKELYDKILEQSQQGYEEAMRKIEVDYALHPEKAEQFLQITEEQQIYNLQQVLATALHNEHARSFRKLMIIEQYRDPLLADIYDKRYLRLPVEQEVALFKILMAGGKMKEADPYVLALQYVSPVMQFIGLCDRDPEREEWCMGIIAEHVRTFNKAWRVE